MGFPFLIVDGHELCLRTSARAYTRSKIPAAPMPVLATNGVRYATTYEREVLDLFTAVRQHTDLDHAGRLLALNNQRHLRAAREMTALFRDVPCAVENTLELSVRLRFELDDLGYEFPRYPVNSSVFSTAQGTSRNSA